METVANTINIDSIGDFDAIYVSHIRDHLCLDSIQALNEPYGSKPIYIAD